MLPLAATQGKHSSGYCRTHSSQDKDRGTKYGYDKKEWEEEKRREEKQMVSALHTVSHRSKALLVLAVVLVIIVAVKPKKLQFDLEQLGVQYMGITHNPPSIASLSLTIHLLFAATNPNKVGIKYGQSSFTFMYRGIPLGKATIFDLFQQPYSTRQLIAVDRVNLLEVDAADLIRDASLRFLGDVAAKIRFNLSMACYILHVIPAGTAGGYVYGGIVAEWNLVNEDGVMKLRQSWTVKTFAKGLEFFRIVAVLAKNEANQ
ncbi:hypothetical protein JHK82_016493 [Glycine max]|nr:hypothetical protein JHK85_016905 [Glycine max]KAG5149612.1 hypothetical protein JHK82_016493 [Glycine max]